MRPVVAVLALAAACASDTASSVDPPASGPSGCEVSVAGPPPPVPDPNGPYYHQVVLANTSDGRTLTGAHQILDHASVPDGVRLADGTVLVYYVNGAQGSVWVTRIVADTATTPEPIALNGLSPVGRVVDPDAYLMPNGAVRLAYFSGFGPPTATAPKAMCIAESSDGVRFTLLGRALAFIGNELLTDPSVVRMADGSWRMAISLGNRTIMARSADGLAFSRYDTLAFGGVPELAIANDGRLRLYVCAAGIVSYISGDGGGSWTFEGPVVSPTPGGKRILCDPSLVAGAGRFVYKTGD